MALPDVEAIAVLLLKADTAVGAIVGGNIATEIPSNPLWPRIALHRFGGAAPVRRVLDGADIQVDCWGVDPDTAGAKAGARDLAAAALDALWQAEGAHTVYGVVTGVDQIGGVHWLPDPDTGRPRYTFAVRMFARS